MNVDPTPSNSNDPEGGKHSNKPQFEIEITPLDGLKSPPRSAAGSRLKDLFQKGTAKAHAEVADILYNDESRPVLSYIGYRTAAALSPKTIPLAMEIMDRRSLFATQEFVRVLAGREFGSLLLGVPPTLKGDEFAPLRAKLADFAVSPDCYVGRGDWEQRRDEVLRLTTLPIPILRGCAGSEVDSILVTAATRGGLDVEMNRRAIDLLLIREESDPAQRVLSSSHMKAISGVLDEILRDNLNRLQVVHLLDVWLSKTQEVCEGACAIRDRLLRHWSEFQQSNTAVHPGEAPKALDTIRLLRHFDDPLSQFALDEAAEHPHVGVSLLARLCRSEGADEDIAAVASAIAPTAQIPVTLSALRVFGYRISPEVDDKLWPVFNDFIQRRWGGEVSSGGLSGAEAAQRLIVLQSLARRFFTERFDSPYLERVFQKVGSDDRSLATVAVNTLIHIAQIDVIPSLNFYDRPEKLVPLQTAIKILYNAGREGKDERALHLAQTVQELFVLRGPAAYGFELESPWEDEDAG